MIAILQVSTILSRVRGDR